MQLFRKYEAGVNLGRIGSEQLLFEAGEESNMERPAPRDECSCGQASAHDSLLANSWFSEHDRNRAWNAG